MKNPFKNNKLEDEQIVRFGDKVPYYIKIYKQETKPGCWAYQVVHIYDDKDKKIGEYTRRYSSLAERTFYPFKLDDQWYATYSDDYTKLRIMTLPNCKKFASTDVELCPAAAYVPQYVEHNYQYGKLKKRVTEQMGYHEQIDLIEDEEFLKDFNINNNKHYEAFLQSRKELDDLLEEYKSDNKYSEPKYFKKIFVNGCYWGGPYDYYMIDLSELKKNAKLKLHFIAEDMHSEGLRENLKSTKLKDLIEINSENYFNILSQKEIDVDDFKEKKEKDAA